MALSDDELTKPTVPAVGIDLGTTYSAVAYIDDTGRPVTLINAEGDLVTPSVVLFEGNQAVVGKEALKAIATEAEHVAQCAKRELGERTFHKEMQGRRYPPEALQALRAQQAAPGRGPANRRFQAKS